MKPIINIVGALSLIFSYTNFSRANDFNKLSYFGSGAILGAVTLATGQHVISKNPTASAVSRGIVYGAAVVEQQPSR